MTQERFHQVRDLFGEALARHPNARLAFLQEACRGDKALMAEVQKLLAAHEQAGGFLEDLPTATNETLQPENDSYVGCELSGRYRIQRQLGRGGFGVVYLARDAHVHGKTVVIKILLERVDHAEWSQRKFRQECKALARINHPGVVGVLDQGRTQDGKPFLVLEFVHGVTLGAALARGQMDLPRVASLIRQIGQALGAAHDQGIYHRDLKPANIMLRGLGGGQEFPVIIDFGVATIKDSTTATSQPTRVAGSYPYMAPEQYLGQPEAASDIYALGVIVYEMITGRRPFEGDSPVSFFVQQKEGVRVKPKDLRPDLPEAAQEFILKALSYSPRERFKRPVDFCNAMAQALTGSERHEGNLRQRERAEFITRRRVVGASLLLVLGVVAAAIRLGQVVPPAPERLLSYFVEVQEYRDGRPFQDPFRLSKEMIFAARYRIRLVFSSSEPGYLYLLNEGPAGPNHLPGFNVLFPSPTANNGSALLSPGQAIPVPGKRFLVFDDQWGEENLWMVWANRSVLELEALKKWANEQDRGNIQDPQQIHAVKEYLEKHAASKPRVERDEAGKQTVLHGRGEVWVNLLKLEHR